MGNEEIQAIYINFIADINDKTAGLFIYLMTEQIRSGSRNFHINISSNGGTVFHAVSIYNILHGLENVNIHTHNVGQIDSSANLIFLAGHKRTACKASTFLLHPPQMNFMQQGQGMVSLTIDTLNERLESLKKDQNKMANIIADSIGKTQAEIIQLFDKRITFSSEEALSLGFITSIEEFVARPGVPIFSITNQS